MKNYVVVTNPGTIYEKIVGEFDTYEEALDFFMYLLENNAYIMKREEDGSLTHYFERP